MNNLTKNILKYLCTKNVPLGMITRKLNNSATLNKLITLKTNDEFLLKVMNSDKPVIVNFHAEWCEPCHILTPKLEELIGENEEVDLATINVEEHAELAHTFEVKAVPAVIAVKNGLVVDKFIGLVDANMIEPGSFGGISNIKLLCVVLISLGF